MRARELGIPATQFPDHGKIAVDALLHLRQRLKTENITAIHSHDYKGNLLGVLATCGMGVEHIASIRGYTERTLALRFYKLIDLIVLRFIPHITTVSEHMRQQLISSGLPPDRIVTIHNVIDVDTFAKAAKRDCTTLLSELRLKPDDFIITIVGRLTLEKGHWDFLHAARELHSSIPESRFLIVGSGPLAEDLQHQTRIWNLDDAFRFVGYRKDIARLMMISDIVTIASHREGLPNVLLEALALGKPVVATQVGGIPEVIQDGKTGILVPARNPQALAQAIINLYRDPHLAKLLGLQGRKLIEQRFSAQVFVQRMIEFYRRALNTVTIPIHV